MARGEWLTIFCYDVTDNKRRNRIAKLLEEQAMRVQYSIFECRMTEARANAMSQRLAAIMEEGDSLRVYVIGKNGERRTRIYGDGPPLQTDEGYWLL